MPTPTVRRRKRGYVRAFTPPSRDAARYLLDKIPGPLWRRVRACADKRGTSLRALILNLLTEWVEKERRR